MGGIIARIHPIFHIVISCAGSERHIITSNAIEIGKTCPVNIDVSAIIDPVQILSAPICHRTYRWRVKVNSNLRSVDCYFVSNRINSKDGSIIYSIVFQGESCNGHGFPCARRLTRSNVATAFTSSDHHIVFMHSAMRISKSAPVKYHLIGIRLESVINGYAACGWIDKVHSKSIGR